MSIEKEPVGVLIQLLKEQEKKLDYIPIHETMIDYLNNNPNIPTAKFKYQQIEVIKSIIKHLVFNVPLDKMSKKNGFQLVIDHLHLNSKAGEMVADMMVNYLNNF